MVVYLARKFKLNLLACAIQRVFLARTGGCVRKVWNDLLEIQNKRIAKGEKPYTYDEMSAILTDMKKSAEYAFLNEVPSQPLQQVLRDLNRAIRDAYYRKKDDPAKKGWPDFKSRDDGDSFRLPQLSDNFIDEINGIIVLPKIDKKFKKVHYFNSRPLDLVLPDGTSVKGEPCSATFKREGADWYVSVLVKFEVPDPTPETAPDWEKVIGADVGVVHALTLSDGTHMDLDVDEIDCIERKIAYYQRKLSKNIERRKKLAKQGNAKKFDKYKPSRRVKELKGKIQNLYIRKKNIIDDFKKKAGVAIVHEYGNDVTVCFENLNVKGMTKSAKGTVENPGRNVRQKSGLNRSIQRVGFYSLQHTVEWVVKKYGGRVIYVPAAYTSQTCPVCGYRDKKNRESQAVFKCKNCSYTNNADVVGALNVRQRGIEQLKKEYSGLGAGSPE